MTGRGKCAIIGPARNAARVLSHFILYQRGHPNESERSQPAAPPLPSDGCAVSRIYGCYVSGSGEIVSDLDESLGRMPQDEAERYLGLLKKTLSGALGPQFDRHRLLHPPGGPGGGARPAPGPADSQLRDGESRRAFYQKVIGALDMEGESYLLLMAHDAYDVPRRARDGAALEDGEQVFSYFLCCVCPVKEGKAELGYFPGENEFHSRAGGQVVSAPELGFLFPAFDQGRANLYNALFYARKPDQLHQEFIDAVFRTEPPMSAGEQKQAFREALTQSLGERCTLPVVQAVHSWLREQMEEHRRSRDPEPLEVTAGEIGAVLADCGVEAERVAAFRAACAQQFGGEGALRPANLIDAGRFQVKTEQAQVEVEAEESHLIHSRLIDGRPWLLIPAGEQVEVNGLAVYAAPEEA